MLYKARFAARVKKSASIPRMHSVPSVATYLGAEVADYWVHHPSKTGYLRGNPLCGAVNLAEKPECSLAS